MPRRTLTHQEIPMFRLVADDTGLRLEFPPGEYILRAPIALVGAVFVRGPHPE